MPLRGVVESALLMNQNGWNTRVWCSKCTSWCSAHCEHRPGGWEHHEATWELTSASPRRRAHSLAHIIINISRFVQSLCEDHNKYQLLCAVAL